MIVQQDFLKRLKYDFRLNVYEIKIWTSLLSKGIATAGELADISGVPRSRCYDVLESLEKKGFIMMKIGRPIKYIAIKPEEIVERVKKNIRQEEFVDINMLESIKSTDVFRELELLHKTGIENVNSDSLIDIVTGRDNLYLFIRKLVEKAKKSVVIATTKENFEGKLGLLKNTLKNLSKKGVKIKIIAPVEEEAIEGLKIIQTDINSRFVIVDNKEMLFMLSDKIDKNCDTGIWVKSELFSNVLVELMEGHLKDSA